MHHEHQLFLWWQKISLTGWKAGIMDITSSGQSIPLPGLHASIMSISRHSRGQWMAVRGLRANIASISSTSCDNMMQLRGLKANIMSISCSFCG